MSAVSCPQTGDTAHRLGEGRVGRAKVRDVQFAARTQHPMDFGQSAEFLRPVQVVEHQAGRDPVEGVVGMGERKGESLGPGDGDAAGCGLCPGDREHPGVAVQPGSIPYSLDPEFHRSIHASARGAISSAPKPPLAITMR